MYYTNRPYLVKEPSIERIPIDRGRCNTVHSKENIQPQYYPAAFGGQHPLNSQLLQQNSQLQDTCVKLQNECKRLEYHLKQTASNFQQLKQLYDQDQQQIFQLNAYCTHLQQQTEQQSEQTQLQTKVLDLEQENYYLMQQLEHLKKNLHDAEQIENQKSQLINEQQQLLELSREICEEVQSIRANPLLEVLEKFRDRMLRSQEWIEDNKGEIYQVGSIVNADCGDVEFQIKLQMSVFEDEQEKVQFRKKIQERNKTIKRPDMQQFQLDYVFGICDRPISNQMQLVGPGQIVFYVSNLMVIQNIDQGRQQFIPGRFKNVTAMVAAQGKKNLVIAVGEQLENTSNLIIVKKRKIRTIPLQIKGSVNQIQLNVDKKYCGVSIGNVIQVWNYKKERLIAQGTIKAQFDKFSFHPLKHKHLLLSGHNYLRLWEMQFQEKTLKESHESLIPLKIEKENKFIDHGWLMQSSNQALLVLLAAGNKIVILVNEQFKKIIEIDPQNLNFIDAPIRDFNSEENEDMVGLNNVLEDMIKEKMGSLQQTMTKNTQNSTIINQQHLEFHSLSPTKKGFILGGTKGSICVYEFDRNLQIINIMSFCMKTSKGDHKVIQLSNSNDSTISIVSQANNQLYFNILNSAQMDTEVSPIQPFLSAGFHNKRVNSISHSKIKQLFVTCSEDNSVKLWNYYESEGTMKKGILTKFFKEEPICAAMHPFGIFIAVGFTNGFKVFAILPDSLFTLKEVSLNSCRVIKYSNGGHMLITNEKSNVVVYDSIYYETMHVFDGHTAPIKDIAISLNDQYIVSTCMNGYVFSFNLAESQSNILKEPEHQEQGIYNSIQYNDLFLGSTNEKLLCIFDKKFQLIGEFEVVDCYLTKMMLTSKYLICGTSKGSVRIYPIPDEQQLEYEIVHSTTNEVRLKLPDAQEIMVHSSGITCIDYDGQYIYTGCEDGSVCMLKCEEIMSEEKMRVAAISNDLHLEEIFKIQKENDKIQQKNFEVIKSEQTVRIETSKLEQEFKTKIERMNKAFQTEMDNDRKMKDTFVEKSDNEYSKLLQQYQEEKLKYDQEIENLKSSHEEKIKYEEQRNQEIEDDIELIRKDHKEILNQLLIQHKSDLKQMKLQFYDKCQKVQIKYSSVVDNAKNYGTAFIQRLEKEEAEYEKEIEEQIKDLKNQIAKVKAGNKKLEEVNFTLRNKCEQLKKDDESLQIQFNGLFEEHNRIRHENLKNDEDILKMQHQLLERLQVIDSKEETCKASKDEQINLENFRYMLDQKIKSLQSDKQLLLDKIADKEYKLRVMFKELIDESNKNEKKYQDLIKLKGQLEVVDTQIKKTEISIFLNANRLKNYESTLLSIIKSNDPPSLIAHKLRQLIEQPKEENEEIESIAHKKQITNKDIKDIIKLKQDKPNELNEELLRQGQWMTKKLYLIKVTSDKLKSIREDNINTIFNQNTKLIEECNMLRGENDKYQKKIKHVEKLLSDAIRLRQRLRLKQPKYTHIVKQIDEQQQQMQTQKSKLTNLKDSMSQILKKSIVD